MAKITMGNFGATYDLTSNHPLSPSVLSQFGKYGYKENDGLHIYSFYPQPASSFILKSIINKVPDKFEVSEEVKEEIDRNVEMAILPSIFLWQGTHIGINCPPIPYYRAVMDKLGAREMAFNVYTVALSRSFEVIRMLGSLDSFLPNFSIDDSIKETLLAPLESFDGTLSSLFKGDIEDLFTVNNAYKAKPENFRNMGYDSPISFAMRKPIRYIDKTKVTPTEEWEKDEEVVFIGRIINKREVNYQHASFTYKVGNEEVEVMYYRRKWMVTKFNLGEEVLVIGKFTRRKKNVSQVSGSSMDTLIEANALPIVPIYSQSQKNLINTKIIMNAVYELFTRLEPVTREIAGYIDNSKFNMSLQGAIYSLHFPKNIDDYKEALNVLAFYELIYMQLLIIHRKATEEKKRGLSKPHVFGGLVEHAVKGLPFTLTDSQKKAMKNLQGQLASDTAEQALISADVGAGKALLETEKVATPNGWKLMKDIKVGDKVIGSNGKPINVVGVYPQGERELAKLTFSDGSQVICDLDHLWTFKQNDSKSKEKKSVTIITKDLLISTIIQSEVNIEDINGVMTKERMNIVPHFKTNDGGHRWTLPIMSSPAEFSSQVDLSVNYHQLGTELAKSEIDKYIDDEYLFSPLESRLKILEGILKENGRIDSNDTLYLKLSGDKTVESTIELIQSLGGLAVVDSKEESISPYAQNLIIQLPKEIMEQISKEVIRHKDSNYKNKISRVLVDVKILNKKANTICIKVDSSDELFVIKNYLVTHNTILAQLTCLQAVDNGYQAVLAAPTEVLAGQLYKTFVKLLEGIPQNLRPSIVFLTGALKAKERRDITKSIEYGEVDLIVGTHSVLNNKIPYKNLGVVCIDEQQKFGTSQRNALLNIRKDKFMPDIISQTATPIPRSTAQIFYGDINLIVVDQKPEGRKEIITEWIHEDPRKIIKTKSNPIWEDISDEISQGHKVFIVVPMVHENEKVNAASVNETVKHLSKTLPGVEVEFVHGQMKKEDQQSRIENFRTGTAKLLVASTVIEVGVDIPEATRMIILSADRLGASSLHQIRGRVGRNSLQSKCYLVSNNEKEANTARLQSLVDSNNGFEIATVDLHTRGEGDLFGEKQAGDTKLTFASLVNHSTLIDDAKAIAEEIYKTPKKFEAIQDAEAILKDEE